MKTHDDDQPPTRARLPRLEVVLVLGGIVLLLTFVVGSAVALYSAHEPPQSDEQTAVLVDAVRVPPAIRLGRAPVRRTLSRADFTAAVLGKDEAQVRAMIGEPTQSDRAGPIEVWCYEVFTVDPVTGTLDTEAALTLANGAVSEVRFCPKQSRTDARSNPRQ
jgi:hypothetical protein